jgi:AraC-like DNA-binding protein
MNENLLQPKNDDPFYHRLINRPSPLLPAGIGLGVIEACHIRAPRCEVYAEEESYFCSLVWGLSGQFTLRVDGLPHTVRGGEFLVLEPGGTLGVHADEEDNHAYYLLLDGPQAEHIVQQSGLWSATFPYSRSPVIWLERIARGLEDMSNQENLASIGYALLLTAAKDARMAVPDKMVWDACSYLQLHWNQVGMNVDQVLQHLNVSRSTLSPRFRKVTGHTILDYLMDIRHRHAMRMLQHDSASIAKIAQRCGFTDAPYFSTWFRKRSGVSPRAMKRKATQ